MFLINEIILQLQEVGLNVVATVCDQGSKNWAATNFLTKLRIFYQ